MPLIPLLVLVLAWWVLAGSEPDGWVAGAIAVAVAMGLHLALGGGGGSRVRPVGLLRFGPWFLLQSVRGGVDVARRALAPSLPLRPGFLEYRIRIREEHARVFFLNCVSLLPGTFSARLDGAVVRVHLLADRQRVPARLAELEERVAALFGAALPGGEGQVGNGKGGGIGAVESGP